MERAEIESRILRVVQFWAPGSKNAKPREFILGKINDGVPEKERLEDRHFRDIYTDMKPRHLLGSHPDYGYFTITCKTDLELTLQAYDKKVISISVTKNMIFNAYQQRYGTTDGQMELLA